MYNLNPHTTHALSSHTPVSDEAATLALGAFFQAILETDGQQELRRIFDAFYIHTHGIHPPDPISWADTVGDGSLKVGPKVIAARSARNGGRG